MEIRILDTDTASLHTREQYFSAFPSTKSAALLLRSSEAPAYEILLSKFRKEIWKTEPAQKRSNASKIGTRKTNALGGQGSNASGQRPQPGRTQKRMRAGQTYYPPTVEDDPMEQGESPRSSNQASHSREVPSPKRQKPTKASRSSTQKPSPKDTKRSEHITIKVEEMPVPDSCHTEPAIGNNLGFTPINIPRPHSPPKVDLPSITNAEHNAFAGLAEFQLRSIFLANNSLLSNSLSTAADVFTKLEDPSYKPGKTPEQSQLITTLKDIETLDTIPGDGRFRFRERARKLLSVFTPAATSGEESLSAALKSVPPNDQLKATPRKASSAVDKGKGRQRLWDSPPQDSMADFSDLLMTPNVPRSSSKKSKEVSGHQQAGEVSAVAATSTSSSSTAKVNPSKAGPSQEKHNISKASPESSQRMPTKVATQAKPSKSAGPRVRTEIDLTGRAGDKCSDSPGQGPSGAKFLSAFDPAGLLAERREHLQKQRREVESDLGLAEDIQRELNAVRENRKKLRKELRDADLVEVQISRRLREIMGLE